MSTKMNSRFRNFLIAAPLVVLLGFVTPSVAYADTGTSVPAPAAHDATQLSAEEVANINALTAATVNEPSTVFNAELALQLGASNDSIVAYGAGFIASGGSLASASTSGGQELTRSSSADAQDLMAACSGATRYIGMYWFGPQVAMNSCITNNLISGISLAAAGGGLYVAASALTVAGLPSAAVVGVISSILAIGVIFLIICRDNSSNGAIYLNGGIGTIPPSCWGQ